MIVCNHIPVTKDVTTCHKDNNNKIYILLTAIMTITLNCDDHALLRISLVQYLGIKSYIVNDSVCNK